VVVPATFNGAGHIVVSGHREAVARLGELALAAGALKVLPVEVSAPFHCPLMAPAAAPLAEALAGVAVSDPRLPVCSTIRDGWLTSAEAIRAALVEQLTAPVLWEGCVGRLVAAGVTEARVLGEGRTLARMVTRLRAGLKAAPVSGPASGPGAGGDA
jgi:[acyl-carrier-protein] S-malonyltransferase